MKEPPITIFRKHGGQLRMSEALAHGITRYMLYSLRDKGIIEQVSRGVYRLMELPPISNPDLVTVSLRYPNAVVCLISALSYHNITTQIPHVVSVAVPRGSRKPWPIVLSSGTKLGWMLSLKLLNSTDPGKNSTLKSCLSTLSYVG